MKAYIQGQNNHAMVNTHADHGVSGFLMIPIGIGRIIVWAGEL
jgi:hypothetical protein